MKRREINVLPFHPFRSAPFDDLQQSRRRRRWSAWASSSLSYLEKINGNEIKRRRRRRNTWNCQRCLYEFNSIKKPFMPSKLMTYSKLIRDFYNSGLIRSTCRTSTTARLYLYMPLSLTGEPSRAKIPARVCLSQPNITSNLIWLVNRFCSPIHKPTASHLHLLPLAPPLYLPSFQFLFAAFCFPGIRRLWEKFLLRDETRIILISIRLGPQRTWLCLSIMLSYVLAWETAKGKRTKAKRFLMSRMTRNELFCQPPIQSSLLT